MMNEILLQIIDFLSSISNWLLTFSDNGWAFIVLPIAIPGIAVTARRIHDFGKSGWMQCIFIPGFVIDEFLGTGMVIWFVTFVIFVIYCSQNGTNGKNKFGAKPKK